MSKSKIDYVDEGWPVVTGCSPVSRGCMQCWAARLAAGRLRDHPNYRGLATPGEPPQWTGEVRLNHGLLSKVERWRKPRVVFVAPSSDLFHKGVPDEFIGALFGLMAASPEHTFLVLTKRAGRMAAIAKMWEWGGWDIPDNVWMGVSVEDEHTAADRLDRLGQFEWPHKWASVSPLLGPIDPTHFDGVDWIVIEGESGRWARAMHPQWVREIINYWGQIKPIFFKQWGDWMPYKPTPLKEMVPVRAKTLAWVGADGKMFGFDGWAAPQGCAAVVRDDRGKVPQMLGKEWRELPW